MKTPKFEIGQKLFLKKLDENQKEEIFIPSEIKTNHKYWIDDFGNEHDTISFSYTNDGVVFYPEETIKMEK